MEQLPADGELLLFFRVAMDSSEFSFSTFAHVVNSKMLDNGSKRYVSGLEFKKISRHDQEQIVRYVFLEERTKRSSQKK